MSVVEIINTDLNISNKNILKNISFSISEGEMVFLIGRTGSGKTTFINSIFGNLEIEKSDKFNVLNYDLRKISEDQIPFLRRKIGFVFQDFKLLNDRSIYDNLEFATIASVEPKLKDRCLTLNGVSKAYCMTGWRLGYCGASKEIIAAMNKIQSQSTTSTSSISMAAAVEALDGPQEFITNHNKAFVRRRDLVVNLLNNIDGLSCLTPQGAFYVYPSCEGILGKETPEGKEISNDEDFMTYLLESEGIAGVHGAAFGLSPYFRLSYATSDEILKDACARIKRACEKLK